MALGFDDQISFGRAILVHWRTHFPGQEIAEMTDTEFETALDKAETDLADWRTKFAVAAKAEGPRDGSQVDLDGKCQQYRDGAISLVGRGDSPAKRQLPQEDDYRTSHSDSQSSGGTATLPTP